MKSQSAMFHINVIYFKPFLTKHVGYLETHFIDLIYKVQINSAINDFTFDTYIHFVGQEFSIKLDYSSK